MVRYGMCVLAAVVFVLPAQAQTPTKRISRHDVPKVYVEARFQRTLQQIIAEYGRGAQPHPPVILSTRYDSLLRWVDRMNPNYEPPPPPVKELGVDSWVLYKRYQRNAFLSRFKQVAWAYLGNNQLTPIDTSFTYAVRARMQARFGPPTITLVELDYSRNLQQEEYIQFEYWFVLNDTIPFIVMDVNGPFDRGIVVVSDQKYRDVLFQLRQAFLSSLMEETPAPYVDYYYDFRRRQWYRTGFDGRRFFTHSIGEPNLARGRPQLGAPGQ